VNPILGTALEVQRFCRSRRWRFCFIGAIAVQRWGEPRLTQDVDLTVFSGFGPEADFVDALLSTYRGRIPDAREFALQRRVLLLEAASGVPIDVSLGGIPFEERVIERSSPWDIGGTEPLATCSAEDLVVLKAFAGREKDWLDVEGVVVRQGPALDVALVRRELEPLLKLKEDMRSLARLLAILDRVAGEKT
jgi:hypothetical protein